MPNTLAYVVLFSWPIVAWIMYARMPVERAFVWTIIGGYLILPPNTGLDLPVLPEIDKWVITNVSAYVLTVTVGRRRVPLLPRSKLAAVLFLVYILVPIAAVLTNPEPVVVRAIYGGSVYAPGGTRVLPGLGFGDLPAFISTQLLTHALAFLVAQEVLRTAAARREVLLGLAFGGLVYTLPALVEIRLSPQINIWVYGFFQHNFAQMIRGGGFRPIVFLPHALWLAFFLVASAVASASLARTEAQSKRWKYALAAVYIFGVIVLSKSLASLGYALLLVPVVFFFSEKMRVALAMVFVSVALVYPALRNADIIPLDDIVALAASYSEERAHSIGFRFDNEEVLLDRAREKPVFGWGGWGRRLLYRDWDAKVDAIADGRWIIVLGTYGIVGFIAEFALLATPVVLLWRRMRRPAEGVDMTGAGTLALLLGITMFDMLLNAPLVPYVWMIAGAVLAAALQPAEAPAAQAARPGRATRRRTILDRHHGDPEGSRSVL